MINPAPYLQDITTQFSGFAETAPWKIVQQIETIIKEKIAILSNDYYIKDNIAIHKTAQVEEHCVIKGPAIISEKCFIAAHAYLRGGIFLSNNVVIGPGCEVKSSI